ncbi:MAG: hypothetical protein HY000_13745 [Planctomycetes bacterium]|nr:hypothetical protein [Planctomycetota bacterium]
MSADLNVLDEIALTDRRVRSERRATERRQSVQPVEGEGRTGNERRQRVERRRQIDPTTCERDYTEPEIEFMKAIDRYRRENGRPFPTWSEVLEVLLALGYEKVQKTVDLPPMITGV